MQLMTMTSVAPCNALHAPQHDAATPFGPLNLLKLIKKYYVNSYDMKASTKE